MFIPGGLVLIQMLTLPAVGAQILINEVNSNSPRGRITTYVELWNADNYERALDGYSLVLFDGYTIPPAIYRNIDLSGHIIEAHGYFLIGSEDVKPYPDLVLPKGFLQLGGYSTDAVAIYNNSQVPTANITNDLVDAVVYKRGRSDVTPEFVVLLNGHAPLVEKDVVQSCGASLNRCENEPLNLSVFRDGLMSPRGPNFCQPKTDTLLGSERSRHFYTQHGFNIGGLHFGSEFVRSLSGCALVCAKEQKCFRFSFTYTKTTSDNCFLFLFCEDIMIVDEKWYVGLKNQ